MPPDDISIEVHPGARPPGRASDRGITAAELRLKIFSDILWIVEFYIPDGLTILAAKPKIGKSWLMLAIAVAVASGRSGEALGKAVAKGAVLYCALEDSQRRLKARLAKVVSGGEWPDRLEFWTKMSPLDLGGLDELRAWVGRTPNARLIVIDTFAKVRSPKGRDESSYEADYRAAGALKAFADETGVAVIVVHHTRKMAADDPLDAVSGTNGLTGAADTILVLQRGASGTTIYGRGRDIEEVELAIEFDQLSCQWQVLGDATEVRRTEERTAILDALRDNGDPMTPTELAAATGKSIRRLVVKMAKSGEIRRLKKGHYGLP